MVLNPDIKKLLPTGTDQLVNYSFLDATTGAGYINYFGGAVSGAFILSTQTFYSDNISTNGGTIPITDYAKKIDNDFDIIFNKPTTLQGFALANIPACVKSIGAAASFNVKALVRIRKVSNGVESEVALEGSPVWAFSVGGTGNAVEKILPVRITIPSTYYNIGETLRVTTELWGLAATSANADLYMGHDPMNRLSIVGETSVFVSGATIFNIQIPMRVDI